MQGEEATLSNVFVYGTLKIGQPNHMILTNLDNGRAHFVTRAVTVDKFPLVIASKFNIPFLLNEPGTGHRIQGEVYRVDEKMLSYLDDFEGVDEGYYERIQVSLEPIDSTHNDLTNVSAYFLKESRPDLLSLPYFNNYDSYGSHGLRYVERFDRSAVEEKAAYAAVKVAQKTQ